MASIEYVFSPDGWKLCLHSRDRNQLFNLNQEPGEAANVYGMADHRQIVTRLAARIHAWQERVQDSLPLTA